MPALVYKGTSSAESITFCAQRMRAYAEVEKIPSDDG